MLRDNLPAISSIASANTWQEAIGTILNDIGEIDAAHSLGLVYINRQFINDIHDIEVFLRQTTGVANWVGAVGFGVCGNNKEYHDTGAISILLLPFDKNSYHVFSDITDDINLAEKKMKPWLEENGSPIILTHIDPINSSITKLLNDLSTSTKGCLIGGICAAQGRKSQLATKVTGWGLSGVMFNRKKNNANISFFQNCTVISDLHKVTKNIDNVIIGLNNEPALNIFQQDIGELLTRNLANIVNYIFAAIPVCEAEFNNYMVRDIIGIDKENNALAIADYPKDNKNLLFCRKDHGKAIKNLYAMLNDLKTDIGGKPIKAGIYTSSARLNSSQSKKYKNETEIIAEVLGDFPLTGFFTDGEIYHNRIYNYTGVLTLFI